MKRFLLLFLMAAAMMSTSAQPQSALTLVEPADADDDQITLSVRLSGVDPRRLGTLTVDNFAVSEPFTDLSITADPRLPMTMGVVVNASVNSELALIQRSLQAYFDSYYRDGDEVIFTLLTGRAPQTVEADNQADIDAVIAGLTVSDNYFSLIDVLPDVAERLAAAQAADPERVVLGLLVASFVNNSNEVAAANAFVEAEIPLHIVQAHTFRESFTESMREMATRTGGIFVNNQAGALALGQPPQPVGALKVLYDALESSRLVFDIRYRSTALDLSPRPAVTLDVQVSMTETASLPFTYERRFDPPVVEFANPSITAARRSSRAADGSPVIDNDAQDIAVYIRFPDAIPRGIQSLQLEVLDEIRGAVVQTQLLVDPQPDADGAYRLQWDLSDYNAPGTITPVRIGVTVVDELGLTGRTQQESSVTVAALPPLPTSTPLPPTATFTPVPPTATFTPAPPTAMPTVAAAFGFGAGQNGTLMIGSVPIGADRVINGLGIIALALCGIAAALLLRLRRMRRQLQANVSGRVPDASYMDMPTPLPEAASDAAPVGEERRIVGRLIVKRGLPAQEIPVDRTQYVIGRRQDEGIDLALDRPFVSPRHCMITYRNNRFLIRDLGSKNGTFVNGERILPERDTIVPNGSEVEITRQIVFELWDPDTVVQVDYHMDDARTERLNSTSVRSTTTSDTVHFPSALGIRAAEDDDGEIGEDYSPV